MKLWERAKQIEEEGKGYNIKGELNFERFVMVRCPGMYHGVDLQMIDYKDKKYNNCQDFSYEKNYTPCFNCWQREYKE